MDPVTGRVYDLSKDDIPDDVRERLVPVAAMKNAIQELQGVTPTQEILDEAQELDVQKEAEELGEILDEFEKIKELPNPKPERFYPVNRAARRDADKRNRALKKRKPHG